MLFMLFMAFFKINHIKILEKTPICTEKNFTSVMLPSPKISGKYGEKISYIQKIDKNMYLIGHRFI